MSEFTIGWLASAKLLWVVLFSTLYWIGGRRWKVIRRFGGGFLFPLGVCGFALVEQTFRLWMLLGLVTYPLALVFVGYGADTLGEKALRRAAYGLCLGLAALPFVVGTWSLWGAQVLLAMIASVFLGLNNPVHAAEEETLIAALGVILVPFLV